MAELRTIGAAIDLIRSVPGYQAVADDLRRAHVRFDPHLPDRARVSLRGVITLGPEPFAGPSEAILVSIAGTLVHEHWHTRQNPFEKTWSFWAGVLTRTHPMRRYEARAYRRQAIFLRALAAAHPASWAYARHEQEAALASFASLYGGPYASE